MQEVNLYVLRREDENIVVEHSPVTDFSGWTVEEILRDTMKLSNDIQSNYLQETYKLFDEGLDNNDVEKARQAYDTGVSMCRPLYYDSPEANNAYLFEDEYMFGDDILVAPVVTPSEKDGKAARRT